MTLENPASIWVVLAILAAIIEVSIPHFGVIFVSVGAVAAALVAAFGHGFTAQVLVFIVALGLSLGAPAAAPGQAARRTRRAVAHRHADREATAW